MNLIDVYVNEVTRRLPEKSRTDVASELKSSISDKLPANYEEADVVLALEKLGDPVQLANQYREKEPYLIGPTYYDQYISTIKMVLPIAITVVLILFFIGEIVGITGVEGIASIITTLIAGGMATAFEITIQVFFWVTLVFFILERTNVSPNDIRKTGKAWEVAELRNILNLSKKRRVSKGEVYASLIWTAVWVTIYFNAMHFIGVYEKNNEGVFQLVTPIFNEDVLLSFWPIIILFVGIEVALAIFKLVIGQWTVKLALANTVYQVLYAILFIVIVVHPDLFAESLQSYVEMTFTSLKMSYRALMDRFVYITIAIVFIAALFSIVEGFWKARTVDNK